MRVKCPNCNKLLEPSTDEILKPVITSDPCMKAAHRTKKNCEMHSMPIGGHRRYFCVVLIICLDCKVTRRYRPNVAKTCQHCKSEVVIPIPMDGEFDRQSRVGMCIHNRSIARRIKYH
jgi:hypothetical protein